MGISGFLKEVVVLKKRDVAEAEHLISLKQVRKEAEEILKSKSAGYRPPLAFLHAIEKSRPGHVGIIAEIKKASPSKGDIRPDLDPAKYAKEYTKAGACAISVLTEPHYFKGSLDDLKRVRAVTSIPVLRKDFTLSSYQIYEAKAAGADSVLLITSMLSKEQLHDYVSLSRELGMEPLVEIHSEWELDKAVFADAKVIGINNRNLQTLEVDLNVSKRVVPFFAKEQIAVEASGISSSEDIKKGLECNIFSFLVGESIVRAENTKQFIQTLVATGGDSAIDSDKSNCNNSINEIPQNCNDALNEASEDSGNALDIFAGNRFFNKEKRPAVKICGLTTPEETLACVKAGADAIGFIFYPKSPRYISSELAAQITKKIADAAKNGIDMAEGVMTTGVFVDAEYDEIIKVARSCSLKAVQLHGNETPSLVRQLAQEGLIVIKALFAGRDPHITQAHLYDDAHAILVEYGKGNLPGGNGESWNWELSLQAVNNGKEISTDNTNIPGQKQKKKRRVILAGGLNSDNIEKAIQMATPWGVDLSSGVEFSPGKKDIAKVEQLLAKIQ